jgi:hypothetical protein
MMKRSKPTTMSLGAVREGVVVVVLFPSSPSIEKKDLS